MSRSIDNQSIKVDPNGKMIKVIFQVIFSLLYFVPFIYIVFFAGRRQQISTHYLNLVPVSNILFDFKNSANISRYNFYSNLVGNVLLFMPLPVILMGILKVEKLSRVVLTGLLLSFLIELLQYVFVIGVSDIDDIILNTLGTFLGALFYNEYRANRSSFNKAK